jgi:ribA/ribD-fused uncharacterized protein
MIAELTGKYRFLSNFWSCFIELGGVTYPSVENAYQAAKCADLRDRDKFIDIKASEAKRLGRVVKMRPNWNEERLDVMYKLVKQKFMEPSLKTMLLATGNETIEEGNWWGDGFWGTVNGVGENHLGVILMRVREELRDSPKS